jgi:hypothetical protein
MANQGDVTFIHLMAKFEKRHFVRIPHAGYSLDIDLCDSCPFGILKRFVKDLKLTSNDEIEDVGTEHVPELDEAA